MARASFRQADIERILRAAANTGSIVQIDIRTVVITVIPSTGPIAGPTIPLKHVPDGLEHCED